MTSFFQQRYLNLMFRGRHNESTTSLLTNISKIHSQGPQRKNLTNLPVKILRTIADQLCIADAVSFALCTRTLYENIGKKQQLLGELAFNN